MLRFGRRSLGPVVCILLLVAFHFTAKEPPRATPVDDTHGDEVSVFFTSGERSTISNRMIIRKFVPGSKFLVTRDSYTGNKDEIVVNASSSYPPFELNWEAWKGIFSHTAAQWAMRCDLDSGVNVSTVIHGVRTLPTDVPVYGGTAGYGRPSDRGPMKFAKRGSGGFSEFAMGGCCELMNRKAGNLFAEHADGCKRRSAEVLEGQVSPSHDVELGRCFHFNRIELTRVPWTCTQSYPSEGRLLPSRQMPSSTPCDPRIQTKGIAHPLKTHLALLSYYDNRFAMMPGACNCSRYPLALAMYTSCSKWSVPDACSIWLPVCSQPRATGDKLELDFPFMGHFVTLDNEAASPSVHGIGVQRFMGTDNRKGSGTATLLPGELGLIQTWKRLLEYELSRNSEAFVILEDDAIQVRGMFDPSDPCMDAVRDGGFVLLGWTNWNEWLWKYLLPADGCVAVTQKTFGTFAVLLSRSAAQKILWWIDATDGSLPIDHVWGHLAVMGVPSVAAFPHIFIADEARISSTNPNRTQLSRAKTSRWPTSVSRLGAFSES